MKSKILLLSAVVTLISACSSTTEDKIESINEAQINVQQARLEVEQEKREKEVKALPDWVLNVPSPDATGYYAVGYGESRTIFKAIKKSVLQAEFGLAKVIKQEISGSERIFEKDSGAGSEQEFFQTAIDKIIDSVQIVGYSQVDQKLIPTQGIHTVYTLLKMPYEQYNKILANERAKTLSTDANNAFSELESRLDKRRKKRTEESAAKHSQKMQILELEKHTIEKSEIKTQASLSTNNDYSLIEQLSTNLTL